MTAEALQIPFGGKTPRVAEDAFVAPTAVLVGEVDLGPRTGVWYGAVLRADCGPIVVGEGSNVQDNVTVHVDPGFELRIGAGVTVGHNAVLHGCVVEDDCLIGMGSTVLNGAVIGTGSMVAAGALVPQGMQVPPGSLVAGVPGRIRRELSADELALVRANGEVYVDLGREHKAAVEN